jgi:hypothetical protein
MPSDTLYDTDIVAWAQQQAAALRDAARRTSGANTIDRANLIEEVESLGRAPSFTPLSATSP